MKYLVFALLILTAAAGSAAAQDYQPVTDQDEFLALIGDRSLTNRLYQLSLDVTADGQITGSAVGWQVTGSWSWQQGYFCREMNWGGDAIPYNCQLVEVAGDQMRFTTDQGAGDSASFRLR